MVDYPRIKRLTRTSSPSISATEAAKTFGRLVDRVRETQTVYIVERGGKPVAQIGPVANTRCTVADFVAAIKARRQLDKAYLKEVEAGVKTANRPAVPADPWGR